MTVNPDVILLSVIVVRRSRKKSNRPEANAKVTALKRNRNEKESKGGRADFSEAGRPASVSTEIASSLSPEDARRRDRFLMLALLADAINIFLKDSVERRLLTETKTWIRGGKIDSQAISFEDACDALGIDPQALRKRLFRLKYGESRKL